jgi:drug/metabolite transporter (DMT)-like permease
MNAGRRSLPSGGQRRPCPASGGNLTVSFFRNQTTRGYGFALLAAVAMSNVYIFSKAALGHSFVIPVPAFVNIAIGALLGPFLTAIAAYSALKYIEASRTALIQSTTGLFVVAGAYLFFDSFPLHHQIAGGLISIAGFIFLTPRRA